MDHAMIHKIASKHWQPADPEFVLDNSPEAKPVVTQYKEWIAAVAADRMARGVAPGVPLTSVPEALAMKPKVTGYRQLSQAEVDLMNEAKALAERCGQFVERLRATEGLDQRWISMGASDLQVGFMKLVRGIAQPTTF